MARVLVTGMSGATYAREVEPLLRRGATVEPDGRRPVEELANAVEELLTR